MPSLYQALEVIFLKRRCEDIIDEFMSSNASGRCYDLKDESYFVRRLSFELPHPNYEDSRMVYRQLCERWMLPSPENSDLSYQNGCSVFNAWLNYVASMMHLQNNLPVCKYRYLNDWHRMGAIFGEDMATSAYLASKDLKERQKRESFDWPICLEHDSRDLQVMMSRKMVDLHAHLYASTDNFDLNWICLMNHVKDKKNLLRKYDEKHLSPSLELAFHNNQIRLQQKVLIAAAIRLFLTDWHLSIGIMPYDLLLDILCAKSDLEVALLTKSLQDKIDIIANIYGRNFLLKNDGRRFRPDYAIGKNVRETIITPLVGERKLLYETFRNVYQDKLKDREGELFYLYLHIKGVVRQEMMMQGKMKGFENFVEYNARKYSVISCHPKYGLLAERLVATPFFENYGMKRYMELRVSPEYGKGRNVRYLQRLERNLKYWGEKQEFCKDQAFDFVFHFIKSEDNFKKNKCNDEMLSRMICRHYQLRKRLKSQVNDICKMRFGARVGKNGQYPYQSLLVGVDAAGAELSCRPEVFAQSFRCLKSRTLRDYDGKEYNLGRTFHVGEVFNDVVDGLRAVDEVLKFLEFGNGDRLGHATVLGVEVKMYYENHNYCISCTKQNLLDNLAWLYVRVQKWIDGKTSFCDYLLEEYSKLFREVYESDGEIPDVFTYYQSWLLRGDDPYRYLQTNLQDDQLLFGPWGWCCYGNAVDIKEARKNKLAKRLYQAYHFDKTVKENGQGVILYHIHNRFKDEWSECVDRIREQLLCKVERKHISIECNPTSNILIGEVKNYEEHPIVKFFNHGLNTPYPSHNVCVSINTDDKGVMCTSLEREYSLMAISLEKGINGENINSPRGILDWLNNVRKMAQEQMFNQGVI